MLQYKIPKSKTILHSIPIGSIMVLLLLLGFLISPNIYYSNNSVYAVEEDNVDSVLENNNLNNSISNNSSVSTYTNDSDSSTSLIIGGAEMNEVVDASVGEVAYRKHTVTISASKLKSYTLFISGPEGLNGGTTITGANGNTPTDMPKNSWGYAYGQVGSEYDMTYNSFTNNAELIDSKLESESSAEDTDFTKNLIFAVKFGNAIAGHYTGTVTLSLAAEPKEIVTPTTPVYEWDKLEYMQQMTPEACSQATIATSSNYTDVQKTLTDSRDGSTYTVRKLDDERCWMTANLRITGDSLQTAGNSTRTLTSADSNVISEYTLPMSGMWFGTSGNANGVYYNGNTTNGAYYSWCAATAGSCVNSGEAGASVCAKGWKLPTKAEYNTLNGKKTGSWNSGWTFAGGYFPAAGNVSLGSIYSVGSGGWYWSSTAKSYEYAYILVFSDANAVVEGSDRFRGYSMRCIAQ